MFGASVLRPATRYQRAEPATTLRATAMASFDIRTPSDLLKKLRDEQNDFIKSRCLDARHALNAVMKAYHLHEWVWGDFAKRRCDLYRVWRLSPAEYSGFKSYLFEKCPALADAEMLTNGTKHFATLVQTGKQA